MEIEDKKEEVVPALHHQGDAAPRLTVLHLRGGGGRGERSANTHLNFNGLSAVSLPCSETQLYGEWENHHNGKEDMSQVKDWCKL